MDAGRAVGRRSLPGQTHTTLRAVDGLLAIDLPAAGALPRRPTRACSEEDNNRHRPDTEKAVIVKPQGGGQHGNNHVNPFTGAVQRVAARARVSVSSTGRSCTNGAAIITKRQSAWSGGKEIRTAALCIDAHRVDAAGMDRPESNHPGRRKR